MLQGETDLGMSRRNNEGNLKIDRRVRLVSSVDGKMLRGSEHRLQYGKFPLDIR